MDIQFFGANCVVIDYRGTRLVLDDNLAELGGKSVLRAGDIALFTSAHAEFKVFPKLVVDQPGEYEVSDVSIVGSAARAHIDDDKSRSAVIYKVIAGEYSLLFTGHIFPELTGNQLESLGGIDVMFVPVGGNGYTLDPNGALNIIKQVDPKLVIPTHYSDSDIEYPVPQQSLEDALKILAMEPKESTLKFRLKPGDLSDGTQLIVLERS